MIFKLNIFLINYFLDLNEIFQRKQNIEKSIDKRKYEKSIKLCFQWCSRYVY